MRASTMAGKSRGSSYCSLLAVLILGIFTRGTDGACTLPTNLDGNFDDSVQGSLTFSTASSTTSVSAWTVYTFGDFTFECFLSSGSQYVMRATTSFSYFGQAFRPFLCWELSEISSYKYIYHELAAVSSTAGDERVYFSLSSVDPTATSTVCTDTATTGTHNFLLASGTISSAAIDCPTSIQGYYSYTIDFGAGDLCSAYSTSVDICTSTNQAAFNYSLCSTEVAYSSGGVVYCLYEVAANSYSYYLTLYNADATTDESTTYRYTCLLVDYSKSDISATQYPQRCLSTQTVTTVSSPGAVIVGTLATSCSTTTDDVAAAWITPVAIVCSLVFIAIIVIVVLCVVRHYRDKKKKSQVNDGRAREERPEGEDQTDPEQRGDGTPHVLMKLPSEEHFRKRGKKGKGKGKGKVDAGTPATTLEDGQEVVDLAKLVYISEDEEEDGPACDERDGDRRLPDLGRGTPDTMTLDKENLIPGTNRDKLGFVRFKGSIRGKEKELRRKRQSKARGSTTYEQEDEDTFYRRVGRKEFKDEESITKPNKGLNLLGKVKALAKFRRKQAASKTYETKKAKELNQAEERPGSGKGGAKDGVFDDGGQVEVSDRLAMIEGGQMDVSRMLAATMLSTADAERAQAQNGDTVDAFAGNTTGNEWMAQDTARSMRPQETVVVEDLEQNVARTHMGGYVEMEGQERPQSVPPELLKRKKTPHGQDVTPNMRIRRNTPGLFEEEPLYSSAGEVPEGGPTPLSNISALARIHRKRRVPLEEETQMTQSGVKVSQAWRENLTDDEYRRLLEELYPDKRYMDYAKNTQEGSETQHLGKVDDGLEFLHERALYWRENHPVVRPATGYDPTLTSFSRPRSARTAPSPEAQAWRTPSSHVTQTARPHTASSGEGAGDRSGESRSKRRRPSSKSARERQDSPL